MSRKVAILQSNYIPWKGYFDLINMVDEFVLYDDVQYTKSDWRNRNRIKTRNGAQWITIPVSQESLSQRICDTKVANRRWREKHWKSICQWYPKAPFFKTYKGIFEDLYLGDNESYLSRINYTFITAVNGILGIGTKVSWSVDYDVVEGRTKRLVNLCKQTGATEYISGPAARNYIEEDLFDNEGICVSYMDYSGYPEYDQLFPPFEHSVSIIDLIFNKGPDAPKYMKSF